MLSSSSYVVCRCTIYESHVVSVFACLVHFYEISAVVLLGNDSIIHGIHAGSNSFTVGDRNFDGMGFGFCDILIRCFTRCKYICFIRTEGRCINCEVISCQVRIICCNVSCQIRVIR